MSEAIDWPSWATKTPSSERENTNKFSSNFRTSKRDLKAEMRRMDVDRWTLEDVTGSSGFPGVVVRWTLDGVDYAVACDRYTTKRDNLRESYLWIKETRKRADRPVQTGEDEFAAARLPSAGEVVEAAPSPYVVLEVEPDADREAIRDAYRERIKTAHPDNGGSEAEFKQVKQAFETLQDGGSR